MWQICALEKFAGRPALPTAKRKNLLPQNEADVAELAKLREQVRRAVVSVLRSRRQDAYITQEQLGYALGVTKDVVYKREASLAPYAIEDAIVAAILMGKEPTPADELDAFCEEIRFSLRKVFPRARSSKT